MDYVEFRRAKGISNTDMVNAIRELYPAYSKIQQTMVCNPARYGVCLLPAAEKILTDIWGDISDTETKKRPDRRSKKNRMMVRLNDVLYSEVLDVMERMGYETTQDFLEAALTSIVLSSKEAGK